MEAVLAQHPNDRDSLLALATFQRDAGNRDAAWIQARHLAELEPENPQIRALRQSLSP